MIPLTVDKVGGAALLGEGIRRTAQDALLHAKVGAHVVTQLHDSGLGTHVTVLDFPHFADQLIKGGTHDSLSKN